MKIVGFITALSGLITGCADPQSTPWQRQIDTPCDNKSHCVSTIEQREKFKLAPFMLTPKGIQSWAEIIALAQTLPGAKLVEHDDHYFHIEVRSAMFGFIDDFEVKQQAQQLHVRSISRSGYSDFGVNRKRAQQFRSLLVEQQLIHDTATSN
ncbi:hypothetical protein UA38_09870 [Photobacterium kishitanii]|uniref:DUF1499 domain-containing protein n=1 Tax=Photobacterium kishitanii TaxID=318456 RepID=A0AAX0YY41_9GAMM|nr:DUF1499 domain-containing protein [Photobacterium kishitanii]KJG08740.1 hypothetical protein UB40_16700 [Photobacterium kishitanii]KJG57567.1 hypothetical protein UA38_09870 [Photobacterium kishitanii]KJG61225.1 hypothetical protein UA42_11335 [Photobacterium kishitanii]KJG65414.1 hypothetical protein UA40_11785 [Photobacterium kishitanii]KJG69519.1 hypothetical protein UA41_11035 [Photobacterium kishitanii]